MFSFTRFEYDGLPVKPALVLYNNDPIIANRATVLPIGFSVAYTTFFFAVNYFEQCKMSLHQTLNSFIISLDVEIQPCVARWHVPLWKWFTVFSV